MNDADLKARLELAVDAARRAGELTLQYFNRPDLLVERKRDGTPVTVADRQAEPKRVASKLKYWAWKVGTQRRAGLTPSQFIQQHLDQLGLPADVHAPNRGAPTPAKEAQAVPG